MKRNPFPKEAKADPGHVVLMACKKAVGNMVKVTGQGREIVSTCFEELAFEPGRRRRIARAVSPLDGAAPGAPRGGHIARKMRRVGERIDQRALCLAGEQRLIHAQFHAAEQGCVGGNFIARDEMNDVAHHQLTDRNGMKSARARDFNAYLFA